MNSTIAAAVHALDKHISSMCSDMPFTFSTILHLLGFFFLGLSQRELDYGFYSNEAEDHIPFTL